MRTGDYGLYAWSNGGDIADVYTNVTVTPVTVDYGSTTALGSIEWALPTGHTSIFQLGDFDKRSEGFANAGLPYKFNVTSLSPADLSFTVGQSDESTDWYYAISSLGTWTILFNVTADDITTYGSGSGSSALLSLSIASYSESLALDIDVNGNFLGSLDKDTIANDPALYRSGRISGEWRFMQYEVDPSFLSAGLNTVGFTVTRNTTWRGLMWDSIILEWVN